MVRISYLVTIFNKAPYLPFMLAGLETQTGEFEREFIFVDDGSTDDSLTVLKALTDHWPNVQIVSQRNQGPARAFNAGLARTSGDYLKPVDGDDMLTPWATESLLHGLRTGQCNIAYAPAGLQGRYRVDQPDGPMAILSRIKAKRPTIQKQSDILKRSVKSAQTTPSAWLASADLVRTLGGCDEAVFIQDYSLELRLATTGPFVRVDDMVFLAPDAAPGRLSDQQAQTLHDINLALGNLLADHPDALSPALRRLALRRATGRAWSWARRRGGRSLLCRDHWRSIGARLGLYRASPGVLRATCRIFRDTTDIRLIPPQFEHL